MTFISDSYSSLILAKKFIFVNITVSYFDKILQFSKLNFLARYLTMKRNGANKVYRPSRIRILNSIGSLVNFFWFLIAISVQQIIYNIMSVLPSNVTN